MINKDDIQKLLISAGITILLTVVINFAITLSIFLLALIGILIRRAIYGKDKVKEVKIKIAAIYAVGAFLFTILIYGYFTFVGQVNNMGQGVGLDEQDKKDLQEYKQRIGTDVPTREDMPYIEFRTD
jgi:hypothetical protein